MSQWMNLFLANEIVNRTDKTDNEGHLSVLSVRPLSVLDKKVENTTETGTDKADKPIKEGPLSVLSVHPFDVLEKYFSPYDEHDYEVRLAIAEYDGGQTALHAHRIAYLDAFISVLISLPATDSQKEWLNQWIQTSLAWIEVHKFPTLN